MGFSGVGAGLKLQASTGLAGFALQNATPNILAWNVPNDGALHRILVMTTVHCTSAETGGQINATGNLPDGAAFNSQIVAGGLTLGSITRGIQYFTLQPGTVFTLLQQSALTAGTAMLWAELWGL